MMEILDGIHAEGMTNAVRNAGLDGPRIDDIEALNRDLEVLGDQISTTVIPLVDLETAYENLRKNLLSLIKQMAGLIVFEARSQTANKFDNAVRG